MTREKVRPPNEPDSFWEKVRYGGVRVLGSLVAEANDRGFLGDLPFRTYAELPTYRREFAALVDRSEDGTERLLRRAGFVRNPAAAWKNIDWWPGEPEEEGSFAWRGDLPESEGGPARSWGEGRYPWADNQLHVHLYELDGTRRTTAVFAHWELSWVTHPRGHYNGAPPTHGDYRRGPTYLQSLLESHGLDGDIATTDVDDIVAGGGGTDRP